MIKAKNRKYLLILVIVLIVIFIAILRQWAVHANSDNNDTVSIVLQSGELIGVVFTVLFTIQQIIGSKEIARATFIMDLNQNYVNNPDFMNIYNNLQSSLDNMQSNQKADEYDLTIEIDKSSISNYLTFFETIYILKNRGVISFDIIDDLFAYRFFLAVHSELFQKNKLGTQPDNFKNIFKLEYEWLEYRIRIGKNSRKKLDEAYNKYINMSAEEKASVKWTNVYEARQLRSLVDEKKYKELIND